MWGLYCITTVLNRLQQSKCKDLDDVITDVNDYRYQTLENDDTDCGSHHSVMHLINV